MVRAGIVSDSLACWQKSLHEPGAVHFPVYIIGRRLDILAWNELARLLIADFPALPAAERNLARMVFLGPAAKRLYPDWEDRARDTVSALRLDAGCHPDDPQLAALVGELPCVVVTSAACGLIVAPLAGRVVANA